MNRFLLGACLAIGIAAPAHAGETTPAADFVTSTLDPVTVYATRSPQPIFDVPMIVSDIDAQSPGNILSSDLADLLEFTPGVSVLGGPARTGQTLSIRGFSDATILTLIDGRRQNFEGTHDGRYFIDPSLLKSVEIVKGSSSAIYGGGAIGGVIAFETKDAADLLEPGETLGATGAFGYRSASGEIAPILTGYGRIGGWDVLGSLTYRHSGDIDQGGSHRLKDKNRIVSSLFKTSYSPADFHTFRFQFQSFDNDGREPNNSQEPIDPTNPLVAKNVSDRQFSLKYDYDSPSHSWIRPKLHLYYNDSEVTETDIAGSSYPGRVQSRGIGTLGFNLDNQSRLEWDGGSHTLSYGVEYYRDAQKGLNNWTPDGTRSGVPNASADNYGFYLQDEMAWKTQAGEFLLIPAARYDVYSSRSKQLQLQQDAHRISPKVALSYKPIPPLMLFGSWSQAFRGPNLTESYAIGQHFPGNFFKPNPDLKPETVTTIEWGGGITLPSLFGESDAFTIKGSWHSSRGKDFISTDVTQDNMARAGARIGRTMAQAGPAVGRAVQPLRQAGSRPDPAAISRAIGTALAPIIARNSAGLSAAKRSQFAQYIQDRLRQRDSKVTIFDLMEETDSTQFVNVPRAILTGWESEITYHPDPVRLRLGVSYLDAKDKATGAYLLNATPLTLVGDVSVLIRDIESVVGWRFRAAKAQKTATSPTTLQITPGAKGYAVHDIYYRWRPKGWTSLMVDFGIENIFDKVYARRFSRLLEEGRNIAARLSYRW